MPWYSMILKASSGSSERVDLEDLCSESKNPHLLRLSQIVSRSVRENSCLWVRDHLNTEIFSEDYQSTKLNQAELETAILHMYGLSLEMIVAAEFARETLSDLFVVKCVLVRAMQLIPLLDTKASQDMCNDHHESLWEIYNAVCQPEKCYNIGPTSMLLWGQGFLKLARSYFVPQGPKEFGKTEYFECLGKAIEKFNQCLSIYSKINVDPCNRIRQSLDTIDVMAGIGYAQLLKARASGDPTAKRQFFLAAKNSLNNAEKIKPSVNSTYNLACVCAQLDQPEEAREWLNLCVVDGTLPKNRYLGADPDLVPLRQHSWFFAYTSATEAASANLFGMSYLERSVTLTSLLGNKGGAAGGGAGTAAGGARGEGDGFQKKEQETVTQVRQIRYTDDEELNTAITYDEELNKLQASLLRDGLSMNTVVGMILEVGKGKQLEAAKEKKHQQNRVRLLERIKQFGLKEKREIPGDGNCQFYSISDQLYDNIEDGDAVRKEIVAWLRENKDWQLSNGAVLWNFAHDQPWDQFCDELARNGIWGNHLTLVAAAEVFGRCVRVISSVEGDNFVTEIEPSKGPSHQIILLSHYAEYHYGSLSVI